jgi:hypothetical protein
MVVSGIHMAGPLTGAQLTGVRVDVPALVALAEFPDTTPRAIAGVLARLINTGELPQGARLPTVRDRATR